MPSNSKHFPVRPNRQVQNRHYIRKVEVPLYNAGESTRTRAHFISSRHRESGMIPHFSEFDDFTNLSCAPSRCVGNNAVPASQCLLRKMGHMISHSTVLRQRWRSKGITECISEPNYESQEEGKCSSLAPGGWYSAPSVPRRFS